MAGLVSVAIDEADEAPPALGAMASAVGAPHELQNRELSGFWALHRGQFIGAFHAETDRRGRLLDLSPLSAASRRSLR